MQLKKIIVLLFAVFMTVTVHSQIYDPVTWDFSYETKGENQYEAVISATIEKESHIYSMNIPEGGPIPTTIRFDTAADYSLSGTPWEAVQPEELMDEAFGFKIKSFSDRAEFRQRVTGTVPSFKVTGTVTYMACNNVTCSPPKDVEFEISIGRPAVKKAADPERDIAPVREKKGLLGFFLISFLAGFAGILTPCVFPMIPLTVAFFSGVADNRRKSVIKALVFGLSIIIIYSSIGVIVSLTSAGAGFANALSTHWIPNIIFFALFLVFAISFFGAFEIILPNKWVTGADSRVERGGMVAAFFLGLTTVIVSFSCTGPIIGALLVEAAGGDVLRPTVGMFGFGLAFALPFTLFALFPSIMSKLPKSGGWLNSIKVVLGFIMLAFGMKFLTTIDSVYSLGLISRDIFLVIWIVLAALLGLYLMGKIKFAHDSELAHIGTFRLFLIIAVFAFMIWLVTGLFGAPLKGLSSLLPPQSTSWSYRNPAVPEAVSVSPSVFQINSKSGQCQEPKYGDLFDMPPGLTGYYEFEQGLECAREQGKPALIDFKGHACANCKVMEARVWSDPEVLRRLRENFVIISLYADDRTQLRESEWVTSVVDGKIKKTIGKINEDLEISRYKTNALPLYVITDHQGNPLNTPMPTNLDVDEYIKWLDEGAAAFRTSQASE